MAVYRQQYRPYDGPKTTVASRLFIPLRYSLARIFQAKFIVLVTTLCMFYPILCATLIYVSHNSPALTMLRLRSSTLPAVDGRFFHVFCVIQGWLAFVLTALVGPSLLWPDLANGALTLYLSRPLSRIEYICGKMMVLFALLSLVTWLPGLMLFMIQAGCEGWDWAGENLWLARAVVIACIVLILLLSLVALAISAWARWQTSASVVILALTGIGRGLGSTINSLWDTKGGSFIDLAALINTFWLKIYRQERSTQIEPVTAILVLSLVAGLCLWLVTRKVKAFEVAR